MATTQTADVGTSQLPAGDWHVLPGESELGFSARIFLGLIPVRGRYSAYQGELHVDAAGHVSGRLYIDAATISTGINKRDNHLRSSDYFAVEQHPHLRFELGALEPDALGALTVTGTLHIRGREIPIEAPISVDVVDSDRIRLDAAFEVDHSRAGLGWRRVPDAVDVHASLTLERLS